MNTENKPITLRAVRVGRSMEVQQSWRGVGRMMRRGLHGAKNWALEPDDGQPRSPGGKTLRAIVVLAPVWLILSAATGGPERGGHSVSIPQSVFSALVVTLIGLAWFSARERRLGREEPWLDQPETDTDSEGNAGETLIGDPSEAATVAGESVQVSEVQENGEGSEAADITPNGVGNTQSGPNVLHENAQQATSQGSTTQTAEDQKGPLGGLRSLLRQATTQGANQEESNRVSSDSVEAATEVLHEASWAATSNGGFSQVSLEKDAVGGPAFPATSVPANTDTTGSTESNENLLSGSPTIELQTPLQGPAYQGAHATGSAQVNALIEPVQQQLHGVLPTEYATPGPYPVTDEPVSDDWWLTKPDIAATEEVVVEQTEEETPVPAEPNTVEEAAPSVEEPVVEADEPVAQWKLQQLPQAVLWYLATQSSGNVGAEEKEAAKQAMLRWLREEVTGKRLSQGEAAKVLNVNRSTVSRWMGDEDPWA